MTEKYQPPDTFVYEQVRTNAENAETDIGNRHLIRIVEKWNWSKTHEQALMDSSRLLKSQLSINLWIQTMK